MAFCILAAGKGTRVSNYSKLHKCLLPIKNQAVLSHIIEKAPKNEKIIIAVGFQKELIKEYCKVAHSDKNIVFADVSNFDGPGSGPGYSLNCCKSHLQEPFYLFCADCIVLEPLPSLEDNWIGISVIEDPKNWATVKITDDTIVDFKNKSVDGYENAFIGVAGIKDYQTFWELLKPSGEKEYEMVSAFYNPQKLNLKAKHFTWYDTGTVENYQSSKKTLHSVPLGMEKEIDEITYKINNQCVKIFGNEKIAEGRIKRTEYLRGLIPVITYKGKHIYAYEWIDGKTLYENLMPIEVLLNWCQTNLWKPVSGHFNFQEQCNKFYHDKTYERLSLFLKKKNKDKDCNHIINGRECLPIEDYLDKINWGWIRNGCPTMFHGDLQFENIIYNGEFYLIDWRDSFGDIQSYGDKYYDLAKLYSCMGISYQQIRKNNFSVSVEDNTIKYDFMLPTELHTMKTCFENWLLKYDMDLLKVRTLSALVYLNMSPLHTQPFSDLLFYHSKYLLSLL